MHYLFGTVCCIDTRTDALRRVTWPRVHIEWVILAYFVVITEQSFALTAPWFSFECFISYEQISCSPFFWNIYRDEIYDYGSGFDDFSLHERKLLFPRWHFPRYSFRLHGQLADTRISDPIKLRRIISSIWELRRGQVNNELKINGITRLCVYW